jgi:hypothetical protein
MQSFRHTLFIRRHVGKHTMQEQGRFVQAGSPSSATPEKSNQRSFAKVTAPVWAVEPDESRGEVEELPEARPTFKTSRLDMCNYADVHT